MILNNEKVLKFLEVSEVLRLYAKDSSTYSFNSFEALKFEPHIKKYVKNINTGVIKNENIDSAKDMNELIAFANTWEKISTNVNSQLLKMCPVSPHPTISKHTYNKKFIAELENPENAFELNVSKHPQVFVDFITTFKEIQGWGTPMLVGQSFFLAMFPEKDFVDFFQSWGQNAEKISIFETLQGKALTSFVKSDKNTLEEKEAYILKNMQRDSQSIVLNAIGNYIDFKHKNGESLETLKQRFNENKGLHTFVEPKRLNSHLLKKYLSIEGNKEHVESFNIECQPSLYSFVFKIPANFDKNVNLPAGRKEFLEKVFIKSLNLYFKKMQSDNENLIYKIDPNFETKEISVFSKSAEGNNKVISTFKESQYDIVSLLLPLLLNEVKAVASKDMNDACSTDISKKSFSILGDLITRKKIDEAFQEKFVTPNDGSASLPTDFKL